MFSLRLRLFLGAVLVVAALVWSVFWTGSAPTSSVTERSDRVSAHEALAAHLQSVAGTAAAPNIATTEPEKVVQSVAAVGAGDEPPRSPRPSAEELSAQWRGLRRDLRWQEPKPEPEMQQFAEWTRRYAEAPPAVRHTLIQEGVQLATTRRTALARMIEQNPVRALEVAVPVVVRQQMPQEVAGLLEEDVKGRGDLMVEARVPGAGQKLAVKPVVRYATVAGKDYEAFVGPRRKGQPSRTRIPLHGIAVDGKMAASDWPGRAVEPVEVASAKRTLGTDQECETSGLETTALADESVIEEAGEFQFFCSASHAMAELLDGADAENALPLGYGFTAESPYTEGTKRLLIIRLDFPDYTGQRVSDTTLGSLVNNLKSFWEMMSYGKTSWAPVGQGSAVTPTLRLPLTSDRYTQLGTIRSAARQAATAAGYNLSQYDFDMIVTAAQPDVGFGGVAYVGAPGCWLANSQWNLGVGSHEIGHNFGLNHASSWDTTDGTAIGTGTSAEYGDPYDVMGGAISQDRRHFNSRYKNYLGWLGGADVRTVTANGTYRVFSHDVQSSSGIRGLKIVRTASQNYWIDVRQLFTDNTWLDNGVFLRWTGNGNDRSFLLDTTPNSSNGKNDAALVVGRTFTDPQYNLFITPVARNRAAPADSVDVTINFGPFPSNRKPTLIVSASATTVAMGQTVTLTATAADADNDTLAYSWEFIDGTFGANTPSITKSWTTNSDQLVRCTVSDMKGGTASSSVLVRVGNPTTHSITGGVNNDNGGVEGVTVTAGSRSTTTNSDGSYALVGLATGTYTVTAAGPGRTYSPVGFANPVTVPPNRGAVNFGTAASSPKMTLLPPLMVNKNSPIGPIPFTVEDKDTPVDALTFSVTSNNVSLVAAKDVTFAGSGANRTVSVIPGTNQTGSALLQLTCLDPQGNQVTNDWLITVNAPPVVTPSALSAQEDAVVELDARGITSDGQTPDADLLFSISGASQGTATVLADGHTIRFVPKKDHSGPASFQLSATDQSLEARLFLYYSFEGPDDTDDGKAMDRSNFGRDAELGVTGGGEFTFGDGDVPPVLSLYNRTVLNLVENGDGSAARLARQIPAADLNFSNQSWTFASWFRRLGDESDDLLFHVGDGTGLGATDELQVFCPQGQSRIVLQHRTPTGVNLELSAPFDSSVSPWQHVAVTFQRTAPGVGTFVFYVNGTKAGETAGVNVAMSQTVPVVVGGHNVESTRTDRWFSGKLDEVGVWDATLSQSEVERLARMIIPHFSGVTHTAQVNIAYVAVNDNPVITAVPDQVVAEDSVLGPVQILISDDATPAGSLLVSANSSNQSLIPDSNLTLGGSGGNRTLVLKPLPGAVGTATITLTANDGSLTGVMQFTVTVVPTNDPPSISAFSSISLPEDGQPVLLPFEIFDRDNSAETLQVTATSSNSALLPDSSLSVEGVGSRRALRLVPLENASGTATVTVTVTDGDLSASQTFTASVKASNDAPAISAIANVSSASGTSVGPIAFTVSDAETDAGALSVTVKSSNGKLLPNTGIQLGGSGTQRTLTLTPAAGQSGLTGITIFVSDGTLKAARTFSLVVEETGNLRITIDGEGTVTPGYLGRSQRAVGSTQTVVATPKRGFVFKRWTGGMDLAEPTKPTATFTMPETLELQANFEPSPFPSLAGVWTGLAEDDPASNAGTGTLSVKVAPSGAFTAKVTYGGVRSKVKGNIENDGSTGTITIPRSGLASLSLTLQFGGSAGEEKLVGTMSDGTRASTISGHHVVFTAAKRPTAPLRNVPAAWLGKYTMAIEPPSSETRVLGSGYASVTVLPTGVVRAVGKLADGTSFSYSNSLSPDGALPMYIPAYNNAGSISGWLQWEFKNETDCDGFLRWFKPTGGAAGWPDGILCSVAGAHYTPPTAAKGTQPAIPALPAMLVPGFGNIFDVELTTPSTAPIQQPVNMAANGVISLAAPVASSSLKLKLKASTGVLTGTVALPGAGEPSNINGVLLQKTNRAAGFHTSGGFDLTLPN